MSLLMLVFSVSPVLAPLAGSIAIELAIWRAVFWAVTVTQLTGWLTKRFGLQGVVKLAAMGYVLPLLVLAILQMVTGAVVVALMGLFMDGSALAMVAGITVCALITWALTFMTLRSHGRTAT